MPVKRIINLGIICHMFHQQGANLSYKPPLVDYMLSMQSTERTKISCAITITLTHGRS